MLRLPRQGPGTGARSATLARTCAGGRTGGGRRAGFSLIELMGVIVVLGMIASLTYVSWKALLPKTELNSAVRELASTLHEARSDAISRNAEFFVEYFFEEEDDHPRGYRIITPFRAGTPDGGLAAFDDERFTRGWHPLPKSVEFHTITLNGIEHRRGRVVVRFDPLGAVSDHNVVLIQMPYENIYTIEVLALTGLIRFHEGEYNREYPQDADFD